METTTRSTLENLRMAIHGVTAPFACEGIYVPREAVVFVFRDKARFEVIRAKKDIEQMNELRPLLEHCKPAAFGDGKKTRFDRSVRDALQLQADGGGFIIEGFDPKPAGILEEIQRELVPHDPNPISAELYSVNVYSEGGHFAPHKDTPRGSGMFGTLVVCLPSRFWRGKLILSHRGVVRKYDWGPAIAKQDPPNQLHWLAFFGDVDHQIERVWGGARVTLAYLLRRGETSATLRDSASENPAPLVQEAWQALLADETFLPEGGILGYPCCHLYHQDTRFQSEPIELDEQNATLLKGRDHLVAAASLQRGLTVSFTPYMFENCADETWQLERFPTVKEQSKMRRRMDSYKLEKALPILGSSETKGDFGVTWIEPHPSSDKFTWRSKEGQDPELPAAALLHSCDYCPWGNFGNESSEVDMYIFAALLIQIPKFGKGTRKAAKSTRNAATKPTRLARKRTGRDE